MAQSTTHGTVLGIPMKVNGDSSGKPNGVILHATLSDEVASVRQIGRTEGANLC